MAHRHSYHLGAARVEGWDPEAYQAARIEAHLTFDALAARLTDLGLPVARSTVHSWAGAKVPRREWLALIAKALGVPQKRLLAS